MSAELSPIVSEFETEEQAASDDRWFRAKVQASLDDPRPNVPHDQVMADMRALIESKRHRSSLGERGVYCGFASGREKLNTAPHGSRFCAQISPRWRPMMFLHSARPMPLPLTLEEKKPSNSLSCSSA